MNDTNSPTLSELLAELLVRVASVESRLRRHENPPDTALITRVEALERRISTLRPPFPGVPPKAKRRWHIVGPDYWLVPDGESLRDRGVRRQLRGGTPCSDCGSAPKATSPGIFECECEADV